MTVTLREIGVNLGIGVGVMVGSCLAFSLAVQSEKINDIIAPRTWARSNKVLKNVLKYRFGVGWFIWATNLSYQDMLRGIPGTGTRDDGKSGYYLRCNLDGLVLVRMQALCFKIAMLVTFGCMAFILPINLSVQCKSSVVGSTACNSLRNLTDFEQTTLANLPSLEMITAETFVASSIVARFYAIVAFAYVIYIYTAMLLWREWVDLLALRRVFYLEYNHWDERRKERDYLQYLEDAHDSNNEKRPSYIPHPELNDTVPNISLWSVLYRLPNDLVQEKNVANKDWQLFLTTQFFDQCIPNQPGFSSSVAAVTILPSANELSSAWRRWYIASRRLRRLRYIRWRLRREREKNGSGDAEAIDFIASEQPKRASQTRTFRPFQAAADVEMNAITEEDHEESDTDATKSPVRTSPASIKVDDAETIESIPSVPIIYEAVQTERKTVETNIHVDVEVVSGRREDVPNIHSVGNVPQSKIGSTENRSDDSQSKDDEQPTSKEDSTDRAPIASSATSTDDSDKGGNGPEDVSKTAPNGSTHSSKSSRKSTLLKKSSSVSFANSALEIDIDTDGPSIPKRGGANLRTVSMFDIGGFDDDSSSADDEAKPLKRVNGMVKTLGSRKESLTLQEVFPAESESPKAEEPFYHMYRDSEEEKREYAALLGFEDEGYFDSFLKTYGPEQTAVHGIEFARSAGVCCPRGCCEELVRLANLDDLIDMEEAAEESVEIANDMLQKARSRVNEATLDVDLDTLSKEFDHENRALLVLHGNSAIELPTGSEQTALPKFQHPSIRQRASTVESHWARAQVMTQAPDTKQNRKTKNRQRFLDTGNLRIPFSKSWRNRFKDLNDKVLTRAASTSRDLVDYAIGTNTFAVVTFTSRQAAIAARQCIVDGNALNQWKQVEDIPVPPLADAAPYNFWHGRNFCRPVTLTINDRQKFVRKMIANVLIFLMYFLYTIPLTTASALLSTENLARIFPELAKFQGTSQGAEINGFLTGLLYTLFLSICPYIFKGIANFGSGATSVRAAEIIALKYYWYFMLLTSFTGPSLASMVIEGLGTEISIGQEAQSVLRNVAAIIPTQVSATWLNWMIVRFCQVFPLFYLFQVNTLLATCARVKWLARALRAGGPGSPVPFRLYVDTAIVFLCMVSLAPVSPLVGPIALLYMTISSPLMRWLVIFVYRPDHDGGGQRWPLIFQMFISSMFLGQIFLTTMMLLKQSYGPAMFASFSMLPTYWFNVTAYDRFYRSYMDAGLLQTSQLDGWGDSVMDSAEKREEYRKWLVDCHRASYVPICLAGSNNLLTVEPAVVLPSPADINSTAELSQDRTFSIESLMASSTGIQQRGATFTRMRRMSMNH
mmetsp:Transcript_13295/g.38291  ORF Transcript_13295/g.38291 Transcript_13295/m.38291 type:complete len:1346 (+) Transcript_13295:296-4333(+)